MPPAMLSPLLSYNEKPLIIFVIESTKRLSKGKVAATFLFE